MIWRTGVFRGSRPSPTTLKARSFAVKMPQRCSSSSTTSTQSVLLAAQSCDASATDICCGTVKAGVGRSAETVPALVAPPVRLEAADPPGVPAGPDLLKLSAARLGVPPRFFSKSVAIFLRIASSRLVCLLRPSETVDMACDCDPAA